MAFPFDDGGTVLIDLSLSIDTFGLFDAGLDFLLLTSLGNCSGDVPAEVVLATAAPFPNVGQSPAFEKSLAYKFQTEKHKKAVDLSPHRTFSSGRIHLKLLNCCLNKIQIAIIQSELKVFVGHAFK